MRVAAHSALRCDNRRPGLPVVHRLENVRVHVSKRVAIERCVRHARVVQAGFHPRNPRTFRQIRNITNYIRPRFCSIARHLEIPVIGAHPDCLAVARRFADGVNRGMDFGVRIVDGHAPGFFLLLFLRIIRREVG